MRITIELDDDYADCLAFTAIGHNGIYARNIFTSAVDLSNGNNLIQIRRIDGDILKMECVVSKVEEKP